MDSWYTCHDIPGSGVVSSPDVLSATLTWQLNMSHWWKIDLYKVLMFPGCFREDLVAGGRHSSWGTKPFCRTFQNMPVFQKTQRIEKKKLQKSTKSKKQNPTLQILPTLPSNPQPARYVCTRQRPAAVPSSPGTSPHRPPGRRPAAGGHRWGGRRERRRTRSPAKWGPQTIAKLAYNSNNYGLWYL